MSALVPQFVVCFMTCNINRCQEIALEKKVKKLFEEMNSKPPLAVVSFLSNDRNENHGSQP